MQLTGFGISINIYIALASTSYCRQANYFKRNGLAAMCRQIRTLIDMIYGFDPLRYELFYLVSITLLLYATRTFGILVMINFFRVGMYTTRTFKFFVKNMRLP